MGIILGIRADIELRAQYLRGDAIRLDDERMPLVVLHLENTKAKEAAIAKAIPMPLNGMR